MESIIISINYLEKTLRSY